MKQERLVEQLDAMVASGRITLEEATRLRAAQGTADFDAAVGAIRARHAGKHMERPVATWEMDQDEADGYLDRLRQGERPKGLGRGSETTASRNHGPSAITTPATAAVPTLHSRRGSLTQTCQHVSGDLLYLGIAAGQPVSPVGRTRGHHGRTSRVRVRPQYRVAMTDAFHCLGVSCPEHT